MAATDPKVAKISWNFRIFRLHQYRIDFLEPKMKKEQIPVHPPQKHPPIFKISFLGA